MPHLPNLNARDIFESFRGAEVKSLTEGTFFSDFVHKQRTFKAVAVLHPRVFHVRIQKYLS